MVWSEGFVLNIGFNRYVENPSLAKFFPKGIGPTHYVVSLYAKVFEVFGVSDFSIELCCNLAKQRLDVAIKTITEQPD